MRILYLVVLLAFLSACHINKKIVWIQKAGDTNSESNGFSICTDSLGNIYTTGNFSGNLSFSDSKTVKSKDQDDCFFSKYNKNGEFQWVKTISGDSDETGSSIVVDHNQDIILAGNFWREIQIADTTIQSNGNSDIFIAKYNQKGDLLWYKVFGSNWMDDAHEVKVDDANNIYVVGRLSDSITVDNVTLKSHHEIDGFIMKLDPEGKLVFGSTIGGNGDDDIDNISLSNSNDIFISGTVSDSVFYNSSFILSTNNLDPYFAKLNNKGSLEWIRTYGTRFLHNILDMHIDKMDNIYTTGYHNGSITIDSIKYSSSPNHRSTLYIAKFNKLGKLEWFENFFSDGNGYGNSLVVDRRNNILLSGSFYKSIQIGNKTYKTKNGSGNAIITFNPKGEIIDKYVMSNNKSIDLWQINTSEMDDSVIGIGRFTGKLNSKIKATNNKDVLLIKLQNN